jgi:hypothetical protein
MTTKPPVLAEVKKQMEADSVTGVLVDTYARIKSGDLQDAISALVLVIDQHGLVQLCKNDALEDSSALFMLTAQHTRLALKFTESDEEYE